jgi:hypothetical protein
VATWQRDASGLSLTMFNRSPNGFVQQQQYFSYVDICCVPQNPQNPLAYLFPKIFMAISGHTPFLRTNPCDVTLEALFKTMDNLG